jgi:hypothetical protein
LPRRSGGIAATRKAGAGRELFINVPGGDYQDEVQLAKICLAHFADDFRGIVRNSRDPEEPQPIAKGNLTTSHEFRSLKLSLFSGTHQ